MRYNTGAYNTSLGTQALQERVVHLLVVIMLLSDIMHLTSLTTGGSNVAIGDSAGDTITTGTQNILIGKDAGGGSNMAAHSDNVFVGHQAGISNNASENTFVGHQAGYNAVRSR